MCAQVLCSILLQEFLRSYPGVFSCTLEVHPPTKGIKEVVTICLSVASDAVTEAFIQNIVSSTFVQTDKPIYMLGQQGKREYAYK